MAFYKVQQNTVNGENANMLYENSLDIVKKAESIILMPINIKFKWLHNFLRKNAYPLILLMEGLLLLLKPIKKFAIVFSILTILFAIYIYYSTPGAAILESSMFFSFFIALILTHFLSPSVHAELEVPPKDIDKLIAEIQGKKLSIRQLTLTKENIIAIENNFNNRIKTSKAFLIILWSFFIFWLTQLYMPFLKSPEFATSSKNIVNSNGTMIFIFIFLAVMLFGHSSLKSYSTINKKIFATIFYAINDCMSILDENSCE